MILRVAIVASTLCMYACNKPPASRANIEVRLAHQSECESATRDQLERLLTRHDASAWRFTEQIIVDDDAIPHSHPILTLHTRHGKDDMLLLSTYIHEQSHWCFAEHDVDTRAAVAEPPKVIRTYPASGEKENIRFEDLWRCPQRGSNPQQTAI
jgi:hypothetical protein